MGSDDYRSIRFLEAQRKGAGILWYAVLALAGTWVFFIVAAPVSAAVEANSFSGSVYGFFSYACHQMPERSFHILGHKLAVCSRCSGVYFGLLFGLGAYPLVRPLTETAPFPRFWLFLAMVPMAVDWSLGMLGIWENTLLSRVSTGLLLGAACAAFIVPALAELSQLRVAKRFAEN